MQLSLNGPSAQTVLQSGDPARGFRCHGFLPGVSHYLVYTMQTPFRHTVLYYGECPVCVGSVKMLRRWDTQRRLIFLPNQDPSVPDRFPLLAPELLAGSLLLASPEGDIRAGSAAVESIVRILPLGAGFAWVFQLPFARPLARKSYRWLANNRYRIPCRQRCDPESPPQVEPLRRPPALWPPAVRRRALKGPEHTP